MIIFFCSLSKNDVLYEVWARVLRLASIRLLFIGIHLEDSRPAMSHQKADVACLESVAYSCDCFVEASLHTSGQ